MDRPLEDLLRALIDSDPHADLEDKQRETIVYALLGMTSEEKFEAIWRFANSISDEFMRSHLLHKLVQRLPIPPFFRIAKRVADSIPIPYWRYSAVIHVASGLLKWSQACRTTNTELHNEALEFIREAEVNIPVVNKDDRSSIIWEAGLTLVEAGELDWAEKLAECQSYCPENTEVLLRVAKARAARGEKEHALQIARKVAELANTGNKQDLTNRPFDALEVAEFMAELGEVTESRQQLDSALQLAIESDTAGDIDGHKCIRAVALNLVKRGEILAARQAASQIRHSVRRTNVLEEISKAAAEREKT